MNHIYQYSDIRAPVQNIIANPRIMGQNFKLTRAGSSWRPHSGLTQVARASARSDSESLRQAGLWATLNLKSTPLACSGPHSTRPGLLWAVHDLPVPAPESPGPGRWTRPDLLWAIVDVPGLADSEARACNSATNMTRVILRHWHSTRRLAAAWAACSGPHSGLTRPGLLWAALDSPG